MAAMSNFQKMNVTHVRQSGDFDVDCVSTACRLAGFVTTNNQWSAQAVAGLSQLIVNQPLKGQLIVCFTLHISPCHMTPTSTEICLIILTV